MRKVLFISLTLFLMSCTTTIKSPATQFEYTGFIKEEGFGVNIKPPFWDYLVGLYEYCTD